MWDLLSSLWYMDSLVQQVASSSLTRDQTLAPALGVQSLRHWTIREALLVCFNAQEFAE